MGFPAEKTPLMYRVGVAPQTRITYCQVDGNSPCLTEAMPSAEGRWLDVRKIDTFAHAAKVVALCLPPVVMSLIGLAALSRKKGEAVPAVKRRTPMARTTSSRTGG